MARTTAAAVQALLGHDYDAAAARDLGPFVATASAVVSRAVACMTGRGGAAADADLELLERWLAAHYYTLSDRVYASRSTLGASGAFVQGRDEPHPYLAGARAVDPTGCLARVLAQKTAGGFWAGRKASDHQPYHPGF